MIPVKEMTSAADVYANIRRLRGVFYPSRQIAPTRVVMAPKEACLEQVSASTPDPHPGSEINSESVNTPAEVDAQPRRDILDLTSEGLDQIPEVFRPHTRAMRIVQAVAAAHGVKAEDILGQGRTYKIRDARFEAVAKVYVELPQWTLHKIGSFFGGRDHTTILHAVQKMKVWERTRAW
jgi:hypothetical protein